MASLSVRFGRLDLGMGFCERWYCSLGKCCGTVRRGRLLGRFLHFRIRMLCKIGDRAYCEDAGDYSGETGT